MLGGLVIVYLLLVVLGIAIFVGILRWALRINDIVSELKAIRKALGREGDIAHSKPIVLSKPKSSWTSFWDAFLYRE